MRIKRLAAVAAILAPLGLAGCGLSQTSGEKVAEKYMEKALESAGGGDVDVDAASGKVTIKSEDGQAEFSGGEGVKLPDVFPDNLVLADDAKIIMASKVGSGYSVAYITDETQAQMFTRYKNELVADGWKKTMEMDAGEVQLANFAQDRTTLSATIGQNNSKEESYQTLVSLVYVQEEEKSAPSEE